LSSVRTKNKPESATLLKIQNLTRGTEIASCLEVADTPSTRNKGLLGRTGLPSGGGLWIVPCASVHTFFMKFPIDLVYIDRRKKVKKVRSRVGPWRLSACFFAHSILELPAGTVNNTQTRRGDQLDFSQPLSSHES
jgi:uncharacterized membrane protein (UPF0127 family)